MEYDAEVRLFDVASRIKNRFAFEVFGIIAFFAFDSSCKVFVVALRHQRNLGGTEDHGKI